jgi:hypothetical protein
MKGLLFSPVDFHVKRKLLLLDVLYKVVYMISPAKQVPQCVDISSLVREDTNMAKTNLNIVSCEHYEWFNNYQYQCPKSGRFRCNAMCGTLVCSHRGIQAYYAISAYPFL